MSPEPRSGNDQHTAPASVRDEPRSFKQPTDAVIGRERADQRGTGAAPHQLAIEYDLLAGRLAEGAQRRAKILRRDVEVVGSGLRHDGDWCREGSERECCCGTE